jgi:hypothetical protein
METIKCSIVIPLVPQRHDRGALFKKTTATLLCDSLLLAAASAGHRPQTHATAEQIPLRPAK